MSKSNLSHSLSIATRVLLILSILLSSCGGYKRQGRGQSPRQIDLHTAQEHIDLYTDEELGLNVVQLVAEEGSDFGYSLDACMSLDPQWASHRVNPHNLSHNAVDLKRALGVHGSFTETTSYSVLEEHLVEVKGGDDYKVEEWVVKTIESTIPATPDLIVTYAIADEMILTSEPEVSYQAKAVTAEDRAEVVRFCLNNPALRKGSCSDSVSSLDDETTILALEKDMYGDAEQLRTLDFSRHDLERFSGTVIVAKRISVLGEVRTQGYDLVLITDDLVFDDDGSINTTPPNRPAGEAGEYDYGYGKQGYRGGDVLIFAKNIIGDISIETNGGEGQKGGYLFGDLLQQDVRFCTEAGECDDSVLPRHLYVLREWIEDRDYAFYDGLYTYDDEMGRAGHGGAGGNVTVITTDHSYEPAAYTQEGGKAGEMGSLPDKDIDVLQPKQCEAIPHSLEKTNITDRYHDCICNWWHSDRGISDKCFCVEVDPEEGEIGPRWVPIEQLGGGKPPFEARTEAIGHELTHNHIGYCDGLVHRHCNAEYIADSGTWGPVEECIESPDSFTVINQAPVYSGRAGESTVVYVDVPANLLPYEEVNDSFVTEFNTKEDSRLISNIQFVEMQHALAPRTAELLIAKADILYKSLSDKALLENDATYQANLIENPLGYNRIDKARHLYASAAYFCVERVQSTPVLEGTEEAGELEGAEVGSEEIPGAQDFQEFEKAEEAIEVEEAPGVLGSGQDPNPFAADCNYAQAQKMKLEAGLNYFGTVPGSYLYIKPPLVQSYWEAMNKVLDWGRDAWSRSAEWLQGNTEEVSEQEIEVLDLDYEQKVALSVLESQTQVLTHTLDRIKENNSFSEELEREINRRYEQIESALQPPKCDFICSFGKVLSIGFEVAELVSSIYSFNFGGAFKSLGTFNSILQSGGDILDILPSAVGYASLLIKGKPGVVSMPGGGEISVGKEEAETFKKKVVNPSQSIYKSASALIDGLQTEPNQLQKYFDEMRVQELDQRAQLQDLLAQAYTLEAAIDNDIPEATAHVRILQDLAKELQATNNLTKELRRQHIEAAAEVLVGQLQLNIATARLEREKQALEAIAPQIPQAAVDESCRYNRMINEEALLMDYMYQLSENYLRLTPPTERQFNTNYLDPGDYQIRTVWEAESILVSFFETMIEETNEAETITDSILSPQYAALTRDISFSRRSAEEIEDLLCPDGPDEETGCHHESKEVRDARLIEGLAQFGEISFEISADSESPDYDSGLWTAEGADGNLEVKVKKRVLDVAARILMNDAWAHPNLQLKQGLILKHAPEAAFLMDEAGTIGQYYFSPETPRQLCNTAEEMFSLYESQDLGCEQIKFFERVIDSAWAERHKMYEDMNPFTVEHLMSASMYGTSIRGVWTIDMNPTLAQLRQDWAIGRGTCDPELKVDCTPEHMEAWFWQNFQGIQYKIFWVPVP